MPTITYVYSAHSAFAYLGSAELLRLCAAYGATLIHRPILLSPVVERQGGSPFAARTQAHVDYFFGREIERWATFRDVPIITHRPTHHDADYSLASGMILALGDRGPAVDDMAHRLLQAHWRDDIDLSDTTALRHIAAEAGHDPDPLLQIAASTKVREQLAANTAWAQDNDIFGSPTYLVEGDPFYGQDHLPLVEHALKTPFPASTWRNPSVG